MYYVCNNLEMSFSFRSDVCITICRSSCMQAMKFKWLCVYNEHVSMDLARATDFAGVCVCVSFLFFLKQFAVHTNT
jgi:hypothetical protein